MFSTMISSSSQIMVHIGPCLQKLWPFVYEKSPFETMSALASFICTICTHLWSVHMSINCVHMLLDLLFKHITNVSVLLYGEIRCVKFKIPWCNKNATPFGFICFIYTIFKEDNTPAICIHAPHLRDSRGIAGVRCWTITFWMSPQCRGIVGL